MKNPDLKTICCEALDDLKAQNILVLDIREISGFADWFIIATASSSRNAKAISNKLIESIKLNQSYFTNEQCFFSAVVYLLLSLSNLKLEK